MLIRTDLQSSMQSASPIVPLGSAPLAGTSQTEAAVRFEKLMWTEMLRYSGLEKAFTSNGGEAVSAFSQFIVEAIAEDLAVRHPLGIAPGTQVASTSSGLEAVLEGDAGGGRA